TYLKVKHKDEIYYLAKGAFTCQRLEEQFKRKEWIDGVPKLKTIEQIFKEKGGYEIFSERTGSAIVGCKYQVPFDDLQAARMPYGFPSQTMADLAHRQGSQAGWPPQESAESTHRVVAWSEVGETEGTGIVHIAPGCGKEDFLLGKE